MTRKLSADEISRMYKDRILLRLGFKKIFILLRRMQISPDHLSFIGFVFGMVSPIFMFSWWQLFAVLYLIYLAFDFLDGSYARFLGRQGFWGDTVDHVFDSIVWILIVISAAVHQGELWTLWVVAVCIINTILVFALRVIKDWRTRGIYLIFYFLGQSSLGLQVEMVYVIMTIVVRFSARSMQKV